MDSDREMQCRPARRGDSTFAPIGFAAFEVALGRSNCVSAVFTTGVQVVNLYVVVSQITAARANVLLGGPRTVQTHVKSVANDYARSMRIADSSRPITKLGTALKFRQYDWQSPRTRRTWRQRTPTEQPFTGGGSSWGRWRRR